MNEADFNYLMSFDYNCVLKDDISRYGLNFISLEADKLLFIGDSIIFQVIDEKTSTSEIYHIIKKYTIDNSEHKKKYFNLPSEISYYRDGKIKRVRYEPVNIDGSPDVINYDYSDNTLSKSYSWHDKNTFPINEKINDFFNSYFPEYNFDISSYYDDSDILKIIIVWIKEQKTTQLSAILKDMNVHHLDDLKKSHYSLIEMLQF